MKCLPHLLKQPMVILAEIENFSRPLLLPEVNIRQQQDDGSLVAESISGKDTKEAAVVAVEQEYELPTQEDEKVREYQLLQLFELEKLSQNALKHHTLGVNKSLGASDRDQTGREATSSYSAYGGRGNKRSNGGYYGKWFHV